MSPVAALIGRNARLVFWRNFLAWQKYAVSSVAINIVDPFIYFLAIGLGLGAYVSLTGHGTLLQFIAPGMLGMAVMNAGTSISSRAASPDLRNADRTNRSANS